MKTEFPYPGSLSLGSVYCFGNESHTLDCKISPENWELYLCSSNNTTGVVCENSSEIIDYNSDNFLVFYNVSNGVMVKMNLDTYSLRPIRPELFVVEFNNSTRTSIIISFNSTGDNTRTVPNIPTGSVIKGLVTDIERNIIFYTDSENHRICSISADGSNWRVLANNVDQPKVITLDSTNLILYWATAGPSPKVEKMRHDGTNREVIVDRVLQNPSGIAVDSTAQLLYLCDSGLQTIQVMGTDGSYRRNLFLDKTSDFRGLALTSKYLFYTDVNKRNIMRLNRDGTNETSIGPPDFPAVYGIYAFESSFS